MSFYLPFPDPLPRLEVWALGGPYLGIQMAAIWRFFLASGMHDSDHPGASSHYKLYKYLLKTRPYDIFFRFNPQSPFGKAVLKSSFPTLLTILSHAIVANVSIRKPYHLFPRIRPHLLQSKPPHLSPRKLLSFRLKQLRLPSSPTPEPTNISPHNRRKNTFTTMHTPNSTPLLLQPPKTSPYCPSLPRRLPREGVG